MTQRQTNLPKTAPAGQRVGKLCFGVRRPLAPDTFRNLAERAKELTDKAKAEMKRAEHNVYTYYNPRYQNFERNVQINQGALSLLSEAINLIRQANSIGSSEERRTIRGRPTALKKLEKECKTEIKDAQRVVDRKDSFDDYFFCEKRRARSQLHANMMCYDD